MFSTLSGSRRTLAAAMWACGAGGAVLCVPAAAQFSDDQAGTAPFAAIRVIPAARPAGLAGAYSALAEGADGIGLNPAGLARESGQHYSGSLSPDAVRAGAVAYTRPAGDGRLAFSASYVDYGDIAGTDENGASTGTLHPFSLYPAVSYARAQGTHWRWGATFKLAQETLGDFAGSRPAFAAAADAGLQYQPSARNLGFGASLTNLGRQLSGHFEGDDRRAALPAQVQAGAFYHPPAQRQLALVADVELPLHDVPALAVGGEYRVLPQWDLRAGTRWDANDARNLYGWLNPSSKIEERNGGAMKLAGGTTVRVGPVNVDYAAQWWRGGFGITHSLTVAWAL